MGCAVSFTVRSKRTKECWNESHAINAAALAAKTKKKPAGVSQSRAERPTRLLSLQYPRLCLQRQNRENCDGHQHVWKDMGRPFTPFCAMRAVRVTRFGIDWV